MAQADIGILMSNKILLLRVHLISETKSLLLQVRLTHTVNLRQNACFATHKSYIICKVTKLASIHVLFR